MAGPTGLVMLAALTSALLGLVAGMWIALLFALGFAAVLALAWAT